MKKKAPQYLLDGISKWPKWKLDALMLDETDLNIRKRIEEYKAKTPQIRRIDRMSINERVNALRSLARLQNKQHHERIINRAADTIESLSAKLADLERSAENCGGGWIYCGDGKNLPETRENILICQRDGYVSMGYFLQNEFLDSK